MGQDQGYMLPPEHPKRGKQGSPTKYDNRSIMNGILWIAGNGAPWRKLSERYGKRQAVYAGFRLWTQRGIFEHIFTALRKAADMEQLSIDSTFCKLYQSTNGRGKTEYQGNDNGKNTCRIIQQDGQSY